MLITMTETTRGSSDGFKVERFNEGQTYEIGKDIGHSLAAQLVGRRQAIVTQYDATTEEKIAELMEHLKAGRA